MRFASTRQHAFQAVHGVFPADCPSPTAEERDQIMELMRTYDRLAQQQLELYDLGTEALVALLETQAQFQKQHEPSVDTSCGNANVHDRTQDFEQVNGLLQQLQDLNRMQLPALPPLPTLFEAIPLQDEQAQPAYGGAEHVQSNVPQRSPLIAHTLTPPQLRQQTANATVPIPGRRIEVVPTALSSVHSSPETVSSAEQPYPLWTSAVPEPTTMSSPRQRHNDRNGQVPNMSPTGAISESRSARRRRHRNRQHLRSIQAQMTAVPWPSRAQVVVYLLKLPTAAEAA